MFTGGSGGFWGVIFRKPCIDPKKVQTKSKYTAFMIASRRYSTTIRGLADMATIVPPCIRILWSLWFRLWTTFTCATRTGKRERRSVCFSNESKDKFFDLQSTSAVDCCTVMCREYYRYICPNEHDMVQIQADFHCYSLLRWSWKGH